MTVPWKKANYHILYARVHAKYPANFINTSQVQFLSRWFNSYDGLTRTSCLSKRT